MRQFDRGVWVILALSAIVLLAGLSFLRHLVEPSDGALMDYADRPSLWTSDGITLAPIEPQASSLQRNDVLIAIEGQSMRDVARALLHLASTGPRRELGQTVTYTVQRGGQATDVAVTLGPYPLGARLARQWIGLVFMAPTLALAGLILARRPNERAAQLFCLSMACLASMSLIRVQGYSPLSLVKAGSFWVDRLIEYGVSLLLMGATLHFALVFPRPHPLVARHRYLVPVVYAMPYVGLSLYLVAALPTVENALLWFGRWSVASDRIDAVYLALTILALVSNYRVVRFDAVTRQQVRWVVLGYAAVAVLVLALALLPKLASGHWLVDRSMLNALVLPAPVCMAIAILRYHLFDIDFYINRAIVHGTLTAVVVGLYVLIVQSLATVFQSSSHLLFSLIATGIVAVMFQPMRERIQNAVNRLMYGERDEPYTVLSRLSHRLEETLAPDDVAPTILELVAQTLKLPYAAIALAVTDESAQPSDGMASARDPFELIAAAGRPPAYPLVHLPLVYQGARVGELRLAPRAANEPLTPADHELLDGLARQAGIVMHAVQQTRRALRLADDLQRSRERLVAAREEERRRLRGDLHDGLGPALASQTLTLDAIAKLVRTDPDKAEDLLRSVREQSQQTISDIRELVYGLRPPALDDLGLVGALRQLADRLRQPSPALQITVQVLDDLPPLPAAVEAAAYRIAQEALTNVVKHARATECRVTLCLGDEPHAALVLEISDNGAGLVAGRIAGVGTHSMRERAEELGGRLVLERAPEGGTLVVAELPLRLERTNL